MRATAIALCLATTAGQEGKAHRAAFRARLQADLKLQGVNLDISESLHGESAASSARGVDVTFAPAKESHFMVASVKCSSPAGTASELDTAVFFAHSKLRLGDSTQKREHAAPLTARCSADPAYLATGEGTVSFTLPGDAAPASAHMLLLAPVEAASDTVHVVARAHVGSRSGHTQDAFPRSLADNVGGLSDGEKATEEKVQKAETGVGLIISAIGVAVMVREANKLGSYAGGRAAPRSPADPVAPPPLCSARGRTPGGRRPWRNQGRALST
jgi:hypothetical protein